MKIYVNSRFKSQRVTGVQRYALEVLEHIYPDLEEIQPVGIEKKLPGQVWEQLLLPRKIKQNDVLWSPANLGPIYHRKQAVTIHDMATFDHPEWFEEKFAAIYRFLLPKIVNRVDRIITVSNYSKSRITEILDVDPSRIIVTPLAASVKTISSIRSYSQEKRFFLYVGSLEPRKNLRRLFEAWNLFQQSSRLSSDFRLKIVGAAGKSFSSMGFEHIPINVDICGYISDEELEDMYRQAICLVYPSLYEGFGLPPLEAMARGTPVISSNNTSIVEVVGDAGILIDPYSTDEIYDAIKMIAFDESQREKYSIMGLEKSKKFSWKKTAEQTLGVLKEL